MIFAPDDFDGDWYAYATNQAGHSYFVGIVATLALAPHLGLVVIPAICGLVYGLGWECGYQRWRSGRFDWRDSLEDSVHVMAGASVSCALMSGDVLTAAGCFAAQAVLLGAGVWRRVWG